MVVNPDPKPGRWLLPLAVLAMFAFTFMFVRTLPEAEVEPRPVTTVATASNSEDGPEGTTSTTGGESEEEGAPEDTSTTTTLPAAVISYLSSIGALGEQLASLAAEVREVNNAWEERTINFGEAEERFVAVMEDAIIWQDNVAQLNAPSALAASYQDMLAASTRAAVAATTLVEGLRSSDTGELRRGAATEFEGAASAFLAAVQRANTTIGS
jgi:hypothetical protein